MDGSYEIRDFREFCMQKPAKIHKAGACLIIAHIISFKILGLSTSTKMYLLLDFYRIVMGGGCAIQDLVFCEWLDRARAPKKKVPKKAEIIKMGVFTNFYVNFLQWAAPRNLKPR